MHVISTDFESEHMNTKRLWNMFNSDFFVDIDDAINQAKEKKAVEVSNYFIFYVTLFFYF